MHEKIIFLASLRQNAAFQVLSLNKDITKQDFRYFWHLCEFLVKFYFSLNRVTLIHEASVFRVIFSEKL